MKHAEFVRHWGMKRVSEQEIHESSNSRRQRFSACRIYEQVSERKCISQILAKALCQICLIPFNKLFSDTPILVFVKVVAALGNPLRKCVRERAGSERHQQRAAG
jgi:hypothetical protein